MHGGAKSRHHEFHIVELSMLTQALSNPATAQYAFSVLRSIGVAPDGPPPGAMGQPQGGSRGMSPGLLAELSALFGGG